jgi:hypothetical protein
MQLSNLVSFGERIGMELLLIGKNFPFFATQAYRTSLRISIPPALALTLGKPLFPPPGADG